MNNRRANDSSNSYTIDFFKQIFQKSCNWTRILLKN